MEKPWRPTSGRVDMETEQEPSQAMRIDQLTSRPWRYTAPHTLQAKELPVPNLGIMAGVPKDIK